MEEIVNLVSQTGLSVAIIIYFLYKDYKFNQSILDVLAEMREVLLLLKEHQNVD